LEGRLKELAAKVTDTVSGMTPDEKLTYIKRYVQEKSARVYFRETQLTQWAVEECERLNRTSARKWQYEHLTRGFMSAVAPPYVKDVTPVLDNDDALLMWAHARMLSREF
jgi:ribosomal protein L22